MCAIFTKLGYVTDAGTKRKRPGLAARTHAPDAPTGRAEQAFKKTISKEPTKEEEILAFCSEQIAHFKVPSHIKFVEEFPMTVSGKIQKFLMRDAMIKELGLKEAETA